MTTCRWPFNGASVPLHLEMLILIFIALAAAAVITQEEDDQHILDVKYDEYPLVVPKRGALVLDRILVALNRALKDPPENLKEIQRPFSSSSRIGMPLPLRDYKETNNIENSLQPIMADDVMGLQRRGHTISVAATSSGSVGTFIPRGRVWRCYFNAVTCFRKK